LTKRVSRTELTTEMLWSTMRIVPSNASHDLAKTGYQWTSEGQQRLV